jgi:hypothetical protein
MIDEATYENLSRYSGVDGGPVFLESSYFAEDLEHSRNPNEITVLCGCLIFEFDVVTNIGRATHSYRVDDVAPPGSESPVIFYDRADTLQEVTIPEFKCAHLEQVSVPVKIFSYAQFLSPALSEGGYLDGPFRHDPDYEYLDPGYSEAVAVVIGNFVNDTFGEFQSFDCECAVIANNALDNLSETFRNA